MAANVDDDASCSIILNVRSEGFPQTIQGLVHNYGSLLRGRWMLGLRLLRLARTRIDQLSKQVLLKPVYSPGVRSSHHISRKIYQPTCLKVNFYLRFVNERLHV